MVDNLNYWYYVKFTLAHSQTGQVEEIYCSNRPFIDEYGSIKYFPILKSIGSVGFRMGEWLPQKITGDIILDCRANTLGYERRFLDLLERYEIINQPVEVWTSETDLSDLTPVSNQELVYTAKVLNWRLDSASGEMIIGIDSQIIPVKRPEKIIDYNFLTGVLDTLSLSLSTYGIPDFSLGRNLPIVFGSSVDVKPILISKNIAGVPAYVYYAYATTYANTFRPSGISQYWSRGRDGVYYQVTNASGASTAVFSQDATTEVESSSTYFKQSAIDLSSTSNYLVTGGKLKYWYKNNAGWTAGENSKFIFSLWEKHPVTELPYLEVARAEVLKSDYQTQIRSTAAFYIDFWFDNPVLVNSPNDYIIGIDQYINPTAGTGAGDYVGCVTDNVLDHFYYVQDNPGTGVWRKSDSTLLAFSPAYFDYELYGIKFTDYPSPQFGTDTEGKGVSSVKVETKFYTGPVESGAPTLTNLDLVLVVDGMAEGAAVFNNPTKCLNILGRQYTGGSWSEILWDDTEYSYTNNFSAAVNFRAVGGRTRGGFLTDIVSELCENSLCRIPFISKTNQLAIWAWGGDADSEMTFTDANSKVINIESRGPTTIINRQKMLYDHKLKSINIATAISNDGDYADYNKTLEWVSTASNFTKIVSSMSALNFGERLLRRENFEYLDSNAHASTIALGYASIFAKPHTYVTFEAKFVDAKYLDLLDIVTIQHPDLSAFYGTSPEAKIGTFSATALALSGGHVLRRAETYRAQIESKEYNLNINSYPLTLLVCRLLTNHPIDPT